MRLKKFAFLILVQAAIKIRSLSTSPSTLILVDPFTSYLSGHCKEYCNENDIRIVELVSSYSNGALESKGMALPENFVAPKDGEEAAWAESEDINLGNCCVVAESDAGVPTAERIASSLNLKGNGISPHLRNKYLTNECARDHGLQVVKQSLVKSWEEAEEFLDGLWSGESSTKCVVKPFRGVASDGVFLCRDKEQARRGFESLYQQPQFGGGINDAVLIQEYVTGQEYAVDTVSKDGDIKVVALWRYRKKSVNGAPFVYECSELVACNSPEKQMVSDYCVEVLRSLGVKWGPTHTEIMATPHGPRLIEVNARFHAQHFYPISRACLGYDALTATMDSYFNPDVFDALPDRPETLFSNGLIMHLVSKKKGIVTKINHEDEINAMSSVRLLEIEPKVGEEVVETVNIRTDSGYVLLENVDSEALQQDYNRILELQETMFEVDEDSMVAGVADALVEGEQQVEQVAATKSRRRRRAQTADPESLPSLQPPHEQLGGELHNRDLEIREAQGLRKGLEEKALSVSKLASHPRMNLLAKKATRVAINTSILLAVYCIVAYSAALALPVVYRL